MTAQTKAVNKSVFEQGDKPQGSDYANLIDSYVSNIDTTTQTMVSDLIIPNLEVQGNLVVATMTVQNMIVSSLVVLSPIVFTGVVSAPSLISETLNCTGTVSTSVLNVTATAIANSLVVSGKSTFGSSQAVIGVNGSAAFTSLRLFSVAATSFSSVQTSAWFAGGMMGAMKFVNVNVNGSSYSMPLFPGKWTA